MALDVRVTIDQKKILKGVGFGIPLLFAGFCPAEVPYTECGGIDEVKELFGEGTRLAAAATLLFGQAVPPASVAVYGGTGGALESLPAVWEEGWRQLVVCTEADGENTESSIRDIAAYVDARGDKIYFTSVKDLAEVTGSSKAITGYERVFCLYHPDEVDCPEAAVVGASAGLTVGSFTYKNQIIAALSPARLTDTQIQQAATLGCYCIVSNAGDTVTTEGKAANGEYLDVVDSKDYVIQQIVYRTQRTLNNAAKVPYDNNGIALLESVCVNVLADAYANGIIAVDANGLPDYSVDYGARNTTQESDREARRYVEGRFTFALAGAVHEAVVHGTIEI